MKTSRFRPPVEPTHSNVTAEVKWYNPTKGFGFVKLDDGAPDAFLHASVLEQAGFRAVAEGAKLTCDIGQGQRGPQVLSIYNVEEPPEGAVPRRPAGGGYGDRGGFGGGGGGYGGGGGFGGGRGGFDRGFDDDEPTQTVEGRVKFFNPDKGFGFILPDDGSRDVFVSASTLERSGIGMLENNQRVRVGIRMGHKGPMAQTIELV